MTIDDGVFFFEQAKPEYVAGGAAQMGDGVLIAPLLRKTHESLMDKYYFVKENHSVECVMVKLDALDKLDWEDRVTPVNQELIYIASEASNQGDSVEAKMKWVYENALPHMIAYLETDEGKAELETYMAEE